MDLSLRRHLYEEAARGPRRRRRALRRQIGLLDALPGPDPEGPEGVREPRRPGPTGGPQPAHAELPVDR